MEGERNNQPNPVAETAHSGAEGGPPAAATAEDEASRSSTTTATAEGQASEPSVRAEGEEPTSAGPSTPDGDPPRRKRRRRRRKRKDGASSEGALAEGQSAEGQSTDDVSSSAGGEPAGGDPRGGDGPSADPGWQTLAAGLFSHLDERQIPCKVDGCINTWTWTAQEQMQAFGQPPPRRMCGEHLAKYSALEDREVQCSNPGCERTWTWAKKAQSSQLQRSGSDKPPRKVCPECIKEERELPDKPAPCRVEGCGRTWVWTRDAQLKHRTWARRQIEEGASADARERGRSGGKRRRRRRGPTVDVHQPPLRMCAPCRDKLAQLGDREVPCKVHGCTRNAVMDRESQLRAWAKLGTDNLATDGPAARRMCETCRDFCRNHPDRDVACGRPGCAETWTYKTGAQLQDFLAGRRQDPIRLCPECSKGGMAGMLEGVPEGMEALPCVVPLCEGVWLYRSGVTEVAASGWVDLPLDRMCDGCRGERGAEPRREQLPPPAEVASSPEAEVASSPVAPEAGAANEPTVANEPTAANEPIAANGAEPDAAALATSSDAGLDDASSGESAADTAPDGGETASE